CARLVLLIRDGDDW
nr:immunoglobulin heavy chain junction region [Macaca mulatta]